MHPNNLPPSSSLTRPVKRLRTSTVLVSKTLNSSVQGLRPSLRETASSREDRTKEGIRKIMRTATMPQVRDYNSCRFNLLSIESEYN